MKFSHLADLLRKLGVRADFPGAGGPTDPDLRRACFDSRRVEAGDLFCALSGHEADGRRFLSDAFERGAAAFLLQGDSRYGNLPHLVADGDVAHLAGVAAAALADYPGEALWTAAVTGTNGKSTIVHMVEYAMNRCGRATAGGGTLGLRFDHAVAAVRNTTPSADILQQWLAEVRDLGARAVVLEASSHGIVQQRLSGIAFDCAAWTNLSHDHLDYHGDMHAYAAAKAELFLGLEANAVALLPQQAELLDLCRPGAAPLLTWGLVRDGDRHPVGPDVRGELLPGGAGLHLAIDGPWGRGTIRSALIGEHNAENLLVAAAMMCAAGVPLPEACAALGETVAAPGRLERVAAESGMHLFVDYAHTPDALKHVLEALRDTYPEQRIGVVFGAGGDRDPSKRAVMGRAVAANCDWCFVTSDNPRGEDPDSIAAQVMAGVEETGGRARLVVDRREAIRLAVQSLQAGDVLLLAGKGHETYQEIHGVRHDFDDRIELAEALRCSA
jgi:UDP-N-acetylmuramoyl-L-alanyl-D-glutamate--2,6-diaminopimelate ligase